MQVMGASRGENAMHDLLQGRYGDPGATCAICDPTLLAAEGRAGGGKGEGFFESIIAWQDREKGGSDPSRGLDAESWREFSRDSIVTHGECMMPSMSVPNWISMITGANPEQHGVYGNVFPPAPTYDSVLNRVRQGGLHTLAAVSPMWEPIVQEGLPSHGRVCH